MIPLPVIEEKEVKLADAKLAKELWPYVRPFMWMLLVSTLLVFVVTFFDLFLPILTQKAIDGFIVPVRDTKGAMLGNVMIHSFFTFGLIFIGCVFLSFLVDFIQTLFMEYTGQKIILNLRCILFEHISRLPIPFFDSNTSGRLVSRVAGDVENMNEMFTSILIFIFKDLFMMAAILVILFFLNMKLALCLLLLVPVILISIFFFSRLLRKVFRKIRQKISEINHSFSEAVTGMKVILTTAGQNRFIQRFNRLNTDHFNATMHQIRIFSVLMPFIGFLNVLSVAIIIWAGSSQVMDHSLTLGGLVAFLTYMKLFFRPLRELAEKFNLLQSALASAERIVTVLNTPQALQRTQLERKQIPAIQKIAFEDICFSYNTDQPVLNNVSFTLEKGQSIGIVGRTGSGKSSIINLITGFYLPDTGTIRINDLPYGHINIKDIRDKTALVMQDPILFSGTIRDNVRPSKGRNDDSALLNALEQANCSFLFDKFDGLDTEIHENGRPLSSGEKQLVCIARAFAFNPDLIIFDEATSYMDSQSEIKVHDAMYRLMKGRLAIIIAHRLSTVGACDQIILLRDGKIRESGTHDELVALGSEYFHLLEKERIQA